jgi:hypothetical protein
MKKTLVLKVSYDVSGSNDTQVDLFKAMLLAGFDDDARKQISFEVLVDDEEEQTQRMMQHVRSEFQKQDRRRKS